MYVYELYKATTWLPSNHSQLKSRGLLFRNETHVIQQLQIISYFRIANYLKTFEVPMQYFVIMWRAAYDGWSKIWTQNPCAHCRLLHILCDSCQPQCHLLLWYHCSWLKLCRERPRLSLGSGAWVWTAWLEHARCISWKPHATWWKVLAHQPSFFRQATLDALFQPPNVVQMRTKSNLFELCRVQPTFVKQNNDDLILAIQSAGVERGRNDFRKNKSTEKNPESEEDLLEHHTDGTDAFDTLYIGCENSHSMIFMDIRWGEWNKEVEDFKVWYFVLTLRTKLVLW